MIDYAATVTVAEYLGIRLRQAGVDHLFGVPGDFNLNLLDGLATVDGLRWVGSPNELGAGYAADAYARSRGLAALITTYGVGELSALNAVAGAAAEDAPVLHVVGSPRTSAVATGALIHHTLADGRFDHFRTAYAEVTAHQDVLTADRAATQIDTAVRAARTHRKPVYLSIPQDLALHRIPAAPLRTPVAPSSDPAQTSRFGDALRSLLTSATHPILIAGQLVSRYHLGRPLTEMALAAHLPVVTQISAKAVIDEHLPIHFGDYAGTMLSPAPTTPTDMTPPPMPSPAAQATTDIAPPEGPTLGSESAAVAVDVAPHGDVMLDLEPAALVADVAPHQGVAPALDPAALVAAADVVVHVGTTLTAELTGFFTHRPPDDRTVQLTATAAQVGPEIFAGVLFPDAVATLADVLADLRFTLPARPPAAAGPGTARADAFSARPPAVAESGAAGADLGPNVLPGQPPVAGKPKVVNAGVGLDNPPTGPEPEVMLGRVGSGTNAVPPKSEVVLARVGSEALPVPYSEAVASGVGSASAGANMSVHAGSEKSSASVGSGVLSEGAGTDNPLDVDGPLGQAGLWAALQEWLPAGTALIADTGTAFWGAVALRMPADTVFLGQPIWNSIGWALPAVLGQGLAEPERRPVLVIGDGAAQMTVQELSTIVAAGIRPVVLLLNNRGYTIERALQSPQAGYNDVADWNWRAVVGGLTGPDTDHHLVGTRSELVKALREADDRADRLVFVEVQLDRYDTPPLLRRLAERATAAPTPA